MVYRKFLYSNRTCIDFTSEDDPREEWIDLTTNFAINASHSPLEIFIWIYPPLIFYTEWTTLINDSVEVFNYQFCGPLINLLKTFALNTNIE